METLFQRTLQWCQNEHDGISNHRRLSCLFNPFFRRRSKKTSKLRVTGLCEGNPPVTGGFPSQRASNGENVSIPWRLHESGMAGTNWPLCSYAKSIIWLACQVPRFIHSINSYSQSQVRQLSNFLGTDKFLINRIHSQWSSFHFHWQWYLTTSFYIDITLPLLQ